MKKMVDIEKLMKLREEEQILTQELKNNLNEEIIYLPNFIPSNKVDYIFIALEPSLSTWGDKEIIEQGFRNFMYSWEDFILHYCISNYLSKLYYVTDISKMASRVRVAEKVRNNVYLKWIELLKEEIKIIGKENCKIVFIGNDVEKELINKLNSKILGKIMHYSKRAASHRKTIPNKFPNEYLKFKKELKADKILNFAKLLMLNNDIPINIQNWIIERLKKGKQLTESRKKLMFTYYHAFTEYKLSNA